MPILFRKNRCNCLIQALQEVTPEVTAKILMISKWTVGAYRMSQLVLRSIYGRAAGVEQYTWCRCHSYKSTFMDAFRTLVLV